MTDDFPEDQYEKGGERAGRDRVPGSRSVLSKALRENWAGEQPITLETNEIIADCHLEELRRFGRDRHIVLLVNDDLPDEVKEIVQQAEKYMQSRLDELDLDVEPHRMSSERGPNHDFL